MLSRISSIVPFVVALALVTLCAGLPRAQGPQYGPPQSVGIDYPIVACKMPDAPSIDPFFLFPDGGSGSLHVGAGADLVVIFPDGSEQILVDASAVTGSANASCVDPCVSFDGTTIYFSIFVDPRVDNLTNQNRQVVPAYPAHIWKAKIHTLLPAVSVTVTQLTTGVDVAIEDQSFPELPHHKQFDMSPVELPDGRILFLSNRSNVMNLENRRPAMRFYRMHSDGSNIEPLENFTVESCQHPVVLMDGHIVWTHTHVAARRGQSWSHPLMIARPDMSDIKTFAGAHYDSTILHFVTQMAPGPQSPQGQGDIVVAAYYGGNNFGHGTLIRFPLHNPSGAENVFKAISDEVHIPRAVWTDQSQPLPNGNTHFQRVGETLATPWAMKDGSLSTDEDSALLPGTAIYAGKATMPAAAPDGNLLFVWSPGKVNARPQFAGRPDMKIAFAPGGMTDPMQSNMTVMREDAGFHYMYPRPLVTYQRIYGIEKPAILPDTDNSGVPGILPAGGPFGTTGTSSVYHRESRWPQAYEDWEGPDPWDPAILTADYRLRMALRTVGQDTRPFANSEIYGVQVVADMTHFFTTDGQWMNTGPNYVFRSHNNGSQVWGILGEAPLRKFDASNQPVLDPWNDPDTSHEVRVPADTPFHSRLITDKGLTLTSEQAWHSVRPGERKTNCGGCHAHSENMPPRDFSLTYAGNPASGYQVTDMALQTPLLRQVNGNPTFSVDPAEPNPRIKIVEWFRDIAPIVQSKCAASCHTAAQPDGELDLASPGVWDRLAYTMGSSAVKKHPVDGTTQPTRYVRKHSAAQSLLIWRIFGERLDGRTNGTRPTTDIDYDPTVEDAMPPPSSPQLTFDEKRLFAMWVDLGCLVDLTAPGPGQLNDPFDDQMKPTLAVSGIEAGPTTAQPDELQIGVYDLHSGIKSDSLDVRFAGSPTNLAASLTVADGAIVTVALGAPLSRGQTHTLEISVADNAGNVSRRSITTTPLHPTTTEVLGPGSQGTGGIIPTLDFLAPGRLGSKDFGTRINHVLPNAFSLLLMSFGVQNPPQLLAPGTFLYLRDPITVSLGLTDSAGNFDTPLPLPFLPNFSNAPLRFQGAVLDPVGVHIVPGLGAVVTPGVTARLGW